MAATLVQYILVRGDLLIKVVLEAASEQDLNSVAAKLTENNISHKLWVEQPENFPTCLALKPYPKDQVQKYFKKFKLYKGATAKE